MGSRRRRTDAAYQERPGCKLVERSLDVPATLAPLSISREHQEGNIMNSEIWKPIEGTDGKYEVSNTGKVRSLNYKNTRKTVELKPAPDPKGYIKTMILVNGKYKTVKLHRLVAKAFVPNPDSKPQVNHKDGDKRNNAADNLEWITNIDNAHHAVDHGLFENSFKAMSDANSRRKKRVVAIDRSGRQIEFESINEASRALEVIRRHIQEVLKGKRNQAKGYTFKLNTEEVVP